MNNKNIVLDFTRTPEGGFMEQPVAIMPAELAKRLLIDYVANLQKASVANIRDQYMLEINGCQSVDQLIHASLAFVQERELINYVLKQNWEPFEVGTPVAPTKMKADRYTDLDADK